MSKAPEEPPTEISLEHKAWTDHINARLDKIYQDLCHFESVLSNEESTESQSKLQELLESVADIQETASKIRAIKTHDDYEEQMQLLRHSLKNLTMESVAQQLEQAEINEAYERLDMLKEAEKEFY